MLLLGVLVVGFLVLLAWAVLTNWLEDKHDISIMSDKRKSDYPLGSKQNPMVVKKKIW